MAQNVNQLSRISSLCSSARICDHENNFKHAHQEHSGSVDYLDVARIARAMERCRIINHTDMPDDPGESPKLDTKTRSPTSYLEVGGQAGLAL